MNASIDDSYRLLAAKHVRGRARQLAAQLDGIRKAEEIECVHQARVASRRLRAAMRMFRDCFKARRIKRWRRHIRRVTAELGDARDKDVQIEFLCGVLDRVAEKACYPGIARLMVRLERQRERLQAKVIRAVDRLQRGGALDEMQAVSKRVVSESKARGVGVQSAVSYAQTEQHILQRLNRLLPYQDSLADPKAKKRHHAMRIAAKRLRYTVEIAKPVYAGRLKPTVEVVKKLQSLLGEVHDCDVWMDQLPVYARKERRRIVKRFGHAGPFARLQPGFEYLEQERRECRERAFGELVEYWRQLEHDGVWDDLVSIIGLPAEQSDASVICT